ncbi:MAG TPA: hypothetical protein ENJ11_08305 [Gammaproteobacteria bacterium]|nr:hypothetical protein [Gammaproteobacteria bacterium]
MKTLLTRLFAISLPLFSGYALAHPGHLPVESVHGFLHTEHIVALAALGVVAWIAKAISDSDR